MTIELPLTLVRRVRRQLSASRAFATSPFTGTQQVQDWGGRWWEYEIEFAVTQGANARRLSVFLDALEGGVGTFILRDPSISQPVGINNCLVNGTSQTGTSLVTDGWVGPGLRAGDFFSLGLGATLRLYRVTADVVLTSGAGTIQFVPPLRSSPADNQIVNNINPGVLLRPQGVIPTEIGRVDKHQFTISAREAI